MKLRHIWGIFAIFAIPALLLADGFVASIVNQVGTTNSVTAPSSAVSGYIEAIRFDVTGTTTGAVTITSADGEQIYSGTITADTTIRPRYVTCDGSGNDLDTGTNSWARFLMVSDKLTITLAESASVTNTYTIRVKTVPVDK